MSERLNYIEQYINSIKEFFSSRKGASQKGAPIAGSLPIRSKKPTVFITRALRPDSVFRALLSEAGFVVMGSSLLQFSSFPFDEIPSTEWIFFSSQNGVKFFFEGIELYRLTPPLFTQYAAIGPATADRLEEYEEMVSFVGTGEPVETAKAFGAVASGSKVLFPQAAESRRSIQRMLGDAINPYDLIVYKNEMRTGTEIPQVDILCFTSPMNAQAYFSEYMHLPHQTVVAIGQTTADTLTQLGIKPVLYPEIPGEEGMAEVIIDHVMGGG